MVCSQRREINFLKEQLNTVRDEKEEVIRRLQNVKDAAKQSLESSAKRYVGLLTNEALMAAYMRSLSELQLSLNEIRTQSKESFEIILKARSSIIDVKELRGTISEALSSTYRLNSFLLLT